MNQAQSININFHKDDMGRVLLVVWINGIGYEYWASKQTLYNLKSSLDSILASNPHDW